MARSRQWRPLLWLVGAASLALGRNYWDHDQAKHHRSPTTKCGSGVFECKAGQRPVQKAEEDYKIWAFNDCPIQGYRDGDEMLEALQPCCVIKHVCAQICGINLQHCFDQYWECAEHTCARLPDKEQYSQKNNECLNLAQHNDISVLDLEKEDRMKDKGSDNCKEWQKWQGKACDCVPSSDWDKRLQERLEKFFQDHQPESLNKKGRFKDKNLWKSWKGKRQEMFFRMTMGHRNKTIEMRDLHIPRPKGVKVESKHVEM